MCMWFPQVLPDWHGIISTDGVVDVSVLASFEMLM